MAGIGWVPEWRFGQLRPLATDLPLALKVARGFGFANIVRYAMETQAQIDTGRSLNRQGVAMGKPTILVEIHKNGSRDEAHVAAIVAGVENALVILGMTEAGPIRTGTEPLLFEDTTSVAAGLAVVYHPVDPRPRPLVKGGLLGIRPAHFLHWPSLRPRSEE